MSDDPETLHRRLTAGDAGRISALAEDLGAASRSVDVASTVLTAGLYTPTWNEGLARFGFLLRGQTAFLAAATASWRLYRTAAVVSGVAAQYGVVVERADTVIRVWRDRDPGLDPLTLATLRTAVVNSLRLLAVFWSLHLVTARGDLDDTNPRLREWFRDGAVKDYWHHVSLGSSRGPRIPDVLLNGDEDGWVPQGLTHDPGTETRPGSWLMTSYRGEDHGESQLSVIDERTGAKTSEVRLTGPGGDGAPHHSGGVALDGDHVYVVSSEGGESFVYRYDRAALHAAAPGAEVPAQARIPVAGSSYATVAENKLWLGNWGSHQLFPYDLSAIRTAGPGTSPPAPEAIDAPEGANGVVVRGDALVFPVNNQRDEVSQLVTVARDGSGVQHSVDLGNMVEEVHLLDGRVYVLNESGAAPYSPFDEGTDDIADLWAQTHLLQLPLGAVTGEGIDVEPPTLREARTEFNRATDALERVAGTVRGTSLPARLLGEVPTAGAFAAAVTTQVVETGRALDAGVDNAAGAATGLGRTADEYDSADTEGATMFDLLSGRLG